MKRMLFAVLTALSSGAAPAQSGSPVTLYGVVDAGVVVADPSSGPRSTRLISGLLNGSRWGLRGVEDLGGGLAAVFTLEGGFASDTGTVGQGGRGFGRIAIVGLRGGFGEVTLGRNILRSHRIVDDVDPFGTGYEDAGANVTFTASALNRADNQVMYESPSLGGLVLNVNYSFQLNGGENAGGGNNTRVLSASAIYKGGPLYLGLGFDNVSCPDNATATTGTCSTTTRDDQRYVVFGAMFDLRLVKLHALAAVEKNVFTGAAVSNSPKSASWVAGATAPLAGGSVLFSVQNRDDKSPANADLRIVAVGYQYPLSRRTALGAYFSHSDNKNNVAALAPRDRKGYGAGLRHRF